MASQNIEESPRRKKKASDFYVGQRVTLQSNGKAGIIKFENFLNFKPPFFQHKD